MDSKIWRHQKDLKSLCLGNQRRTKRYITRIISAKVFLTAKKIKPNRQKTTTETNYMSDNRFVKCTRTDLQSHCLSGNQ